MDGRRILAAAAVVAVFGGGLAIGLATRSDPAAGPSGIDWSSPTELPPPERADPRSELVGEEEGYRFWPRSGRVAPSVAYRFDTGHCGLAFLADFDGSFWQPIVPDGRPPEFLHNQDAGAIALVDFNGAVYRSSTGIETRLERVRGPVVTQPCA